MKRAVRTRALKGSGANLPSPSDLDVIQQNSRQPKGTYQFTHSWERKEIAPGRLWRCNLRRTNGQVGCRALTSKPDQNGLGQAWQKKLSDEQPRHHRCYSQLARIAQQAHSIALQSPCFIAPAMATANKSSKRIMVRRGLPGRCKEAELQQERALDVQSVACQLVSTQLASKSELLQGFSACSCVQSELQDWHMNPPEGCSFQDKENDSLTSWNIW